MSHCPSRKAEPFGKGSAAARSEAGDLAVPASVRKDGATVGVINCVQPFDEWQVSEECVPQCPCEESDERVA
jgi:hypothetical protein